MEHPGLSRKEIRQLVRRELIGMLVNGAEVIHETGYPWGQFELKPMFGTSEGSFGKGELDTFAEVMAEEAGRLAADAPH